MALIEPEFGRIASEDLNNLAQDLIPVLRDMVVGND
jgi:hypothetical protein